MIKSAIPNDNWICVPVKEYIYKLNEPDIWQDMMSWCDEQVHDTRYSCDAGVPNLDRVTLLPVFKNSKFWFESPEMANWFNLRWSHLC